MNQASRGSFKCRFLGPTQDLLNQNLHFHKVPQMMLTHFKIWELNCSLHFKDIYLQRKSELFQMKTVWISMQIHDKPCWLSKNIWETLGYSILPIKLRPGDSSLQRPVCATELPSTLSGSRGGTVHSVPGLWPWPAALPQTCPPRL